MKQSILLMIFFTLFSAYAGDPLLVAVLMIKDEVAVIEKTLEPLVKGGIQDFFILDTGSTDGTLELVQQFFQRHSLRNAYIMQEPFVDFSTSRNRTLELAERQFPQATFMLMLDANWYVNNVPGLLDFCKGHAHEVNVPSYMITVINHAQNSPSTYKSQRLFRCAERIRYHGVVHECIDKGSSQWVPSTVYIDQVPGEFGQTKSDRRLLRDRELLTKEYIKNPRNSRTLYYLAQTYSCLSDWENTCKFYKLRCALGTDDEETYMAWYRLALASENLYIKNEPEYWPVILEYYLHAYSLRPHRAEPLVYIADYYYRHDNRALCYLFARRALELPFPHNEIELVECDIYIFKRYELVSICAWNVGAYEIGELATRKALEARPDLAHLHHNLALYLERKQQK